MEFTLLWQALLGVAALDLAARRQERRGLISPEVGLGDRLVGAAVIGLFLGRLGAMAAQGVNPVMNPSDILVIRGGVHTGAASIAAVFALVWLLREDLWSGLDAAAPAVLAGLAGWHAGCLFRTACLGTASGLPWAWAQQGSLVTRHPVELYAAGILVVAAVGAYRGGTRWPPGVLAGSALTAASLSRLLTEPIRPSIRGGPIGWYVAGVVIGLAVVGLRYVQPPSEGSDSPGRRGLWHSMIRR